MIKGSTYQYRDGEKFYYSSDLDGGCFCQKDFMTGTENHKIEPPSHVKGYCFGCQKKFFYKLGKWQEFV